MEKLEQLKQQMIEYNAGIPNYIQHLLKVHSLARLIGLGEGLDEHTQFTLEAAALVHDIGIRPADEKYNDHKISRCHNCWSFYIDIQKILISSNENIYVFNDGSVKNRIVFYISDEIKTFVSNIIRMYMHHLVLYGFLLSNQ